MVLKWIHLSRCPKFEIVCLIIYIVSSAFSFVYIFLTVKTSILQQYMPPTYFHLFLPSEYVLTLWTSLLLDGIRLLLQCVIRNVWKVVLTGRLNLLGRLRLVLSLRLCPCGKRNHTCCNVQKISNTYTVKRQQMSRH